MKKLKSIFIIVTAFIIFACGYYFIPIHGTFDKTFITISTFVFTVLVGFFISRQGSRYSEIRKSVSTIDGNFSSIYRSFGHLGIPSQQQAGDIIKQYYQNIITNGSWSYNFNHKTTTLIDLHNILENSSDKSFSPVASAGLSRVMLCLGNIQIERKNLVVVCEERIPLFQWVTIFFLSIMLLFTLFVAIPSYNMVVETVLKSVFSTSVVIVLILLYQLDRLKLFEGVIGEHSAQDVIDIIDSIK